MAAATKPSRSKIAAPKVEHKSLDPCRDLTTKRGSSQITQLTVDEYLRKLNAWDGTVVSDLPSDSAAEYQHGVLDINYITPR